MNPVEIAKMELDIVDRMDKGESNVQVMEYLVNHYPKHSALDLVEVIRQVYSELQGAYEEISQNTP